MNNQLSIINRVVIHPKYRTVGLGAKLIRETMPRVGTRYVELIAVMAKYSPFAEKAGMQKIAEQQTVKGISKVNKVLLELGFDAQLLGSERYGVAKLEGLQPEQINKLKEAFIKNKHTRFRREFAASQHQPFGKVAEYIVGRHNAELPTLVKLVKLVGMPNQKKVYLFWVR